MLRTRGGDRETERNYTNTVKFKLYAFWGEKCCHIALRQTSGTNRYAREKAQGNWEKIMAVTEEKRTNYECNHRFTMLKKESTFQKLINPKLRSILASKYYRKSVRSLLHRLTLLRCLNSMSCSLKHRGWEMKDWHSNLLRRKEPEQNMKEDDLSKREARYTMNYNKEWKKS